MNENESTAQYIARLEKEMRERQGEAQKTATASQPLLAAEEARRAALAREAAAAQKQREEDEARLARIAAELEQAKRQAEGERLTAIRDAVETSPEAGTLAGRAKADRDKYGATGTDLRNSDICMESARIFEAVTGIDGTYELWRLLEPTVSAEMYLFGLRWSAFHMPGEGSTLRVDCGAHGPQPVPNLAELDRWASEQPTLFAALLNAGVATP